MRYQRTELPRAGRPPPAAASWLVYWEWRGWKGFLSRLVPLGEFRIGVTLAEQGEALEQVREGNGGGDVHEHANDRLGLERLCRYGARGALALTRLSRAQDGRIAWRMKRPLPDGTTHLYFTG